MPVVKADAVSKYIFNLVIVGRYEEQEGIGWIGCLSLSLTVCVPSYLLNYYCCRAGIRLHQAIVGFLFIPCRFMLIRYRVCGSRLRPNFGYVAGDSRNEAEASESVGVGIGWTTVAGKPGKIPAMPAIAMLKLPPGWHSSRLYWTVKYSAGGPCGLLGGLVAGPAMGGAIHRFRVRQSQTI